MNNTIETPTPTKRLKLLAGSRADTGHSFTFATPNDTPSIYQTASSHKTGSSLKRELVSSAIRQNMDQILQDIEEETEGPINSEASPLADKTLQANTSSPAFGSEISSISPYGPSSQPLCTEALIRSNIKSLNKTNMNNATFVEISALSPMIRKMTEQVGNQFEQRIR